jgi:hypothetical protein
MSVKWFSPPNLASLTFAPRGLHRHRRRIVVHAQLDAQTGAGRKTFLVDRVQTINNTAAARKFQFSKSMMTCDSNTNTSVAEEIPMQAPRSGLRVRRPAWPKTKARSLALVGGGVW